MCLDIFYTLPQIDGDLILWRIQPELKLYINGLSEEFSSLEELNLEQLSLYLFEQLRGDSDHQLLRKVWQCWLAKRCLTVVWRIKTRLASYFSSYELADLLQLCYLVVINPRDFFAGFTMSSFSNSFYTKLTNFADGKLKRSLIDQVRKIKNDPYIGITDLGVAVRSSKIKWQGTATYDTEINQYNLLWGCVNEFKQSTNLSCNKWQETEFQQISDRYNQRMSTLPALTGEEVKIILNRIGKQIRFIKQPHIHSGDSPISNNLEGEGTMLLDNISSPVTEDFDEETLQLRKCINNTLETLKEPEQNLLNLYYGLGLKQNQIAQEMGVNQATISRKIQNLQSKMLEKILADFQEDTPVSSEIMNYFEQSMKNFYATYVKS